MFIFPTTPIHMRMLARRSIITALALLSSYENCGRILSADSDGIEVSATAIPALPSSASHFLINNVRIFDGHSAALSAPSNVLIVGNVITRIRTESIEADGAQVIEGGGRTLMPGLIDAHTHIMFETLPRMVILASDIGFIDIAAGKAALDMLMRGFTSARVVGGPVFGLKRGIDAGYVAGSRIWPSAAANVRE